MAIEIIDEGQNNVILLDPHHKEDGTGQIRCIGNNNRVVIINPLVFNKLFVEAANGANIVVGKHAAVNKLWLTSLKGASIEIGRELRVNGSVSIRADEEANITMGDDCLLAPGVKIWSSDMHSIFELSTGKRINHARDIIIENHVWLCDEVKVLKGSIIRSNSVIGSNSVVAREIPANSVAVGNHVQVKKTGINWSIDLI